MSDLAGGVARIVAVVRNPGIVGVAAAVVGEILFTHDGGLGCVVM